ncbi:NYN domain-containing protein [Patescibacteria group bacterium]|nr:NYN domain-containing protein [Patescibacteria group bacterium]
MISKYIKGKVYVFIDVENVFYSQDTLGWKISYEKLIKYFKSECGDNTKCFAYTGVDKNNSGQKKFLDMLDINGYILRTKEIKKINTGHERYKWKSNLDVEIALEIVELRESYDTAILMSGDSDFAAPIDKIKKDRKRIIVMSTRGRVARELIERAKFVDLRKLKTIISQ